MASEPPPPPQKRPSPAPTSINDLGADLLREVFLRLPSLAALARATLACNTWRRAVSSSPAFRLRFRRLHPPPLLGFFFQTDDDVIKIPQFAPACRSDRDLAAAVRRGDFFLTLLPQGGEHWQVCDCRDGRLILQHVKDDILAVYNPLKQSLQLVEFVYCPIGECPNSFHLLISHDDPASFRIVYIWCDETNGLRVRAAVFSSETHQWSTLPWVKFATSHYEIEIEIWLKHGMQANGLIYCEHKEFMVTLDTETLEFATMELPGTMRMELQGQNENRAKFMVGETKDGEACGVYALGFNVKVWLCGADGGGVRRWMLHKVVNLRSEFARIYRERLSAEWGLDVLAVSDGIVYLAVSDMPEPDDNPWILSLCLETMRLEKLFQRRYDHKNIEPDCLNVYPYIMPWPSHLMKENLGSKK